MSTEAWKSQSSVKRCAWDPEGSLRGTRLWLNKAGLNKPGLWERARKGFKLLSTMGKITKADSHEGHKVTWAVKISELQDRRGIGSGQYSAVSRQVRTWKMQPVGPGPGVRGWPSPCWFHRAINSRKHNQVGRVSECLEHSRGKIFLHCHESCLF